MVEEKKGRTFNHLVAYYFKTACFDCEDKIIEETERKMIILFNTDRISKEEVNKLLVTQRVRNNDKILILPEATAINLTDLSSENDKRKTFKNLVGYYIIGKDINDNIIKDYEIILFNKDRISKEEMNELLTTLNALTSDKVAMLSKTKAMNLTDLHDEEKMQEINA